MKLRSRSSSNPPTFGAESPRSLVPRRGCRAKAPIVTHVAGVKAAGGPGLRFAAPKLQSSNDETPPRSGASREDHHADTTQTRHDAGRRRSAGHKRATGAAAARKQAHDRRRPGAFLESKYAGLGL